MQYLPLVDDDSVYITNGKYFLLNDNMQLSQSKQMVSVFPQDLPQATIWYFFNKKQQQSKEGNWLLGQFGWLLKGTIIHCHIMMSAA